MRRSRSRRPSWCRRNGVARSRRALRLPLGLVVSEHRVIHAGLLQVGGDVHPREGDETDTRIVNLAGEKLGKVFANLLADPGRALGH